MSNEVLNCSDAPRHKLLNPNGGKELYQPSCCSPLHNPSSKTVSGGMVGASKLSELIYGKEVPSNDSSPYHRSYLSKQQRQPDPSPRCCSTTHNMSRCHGTRRESFLLLGDERDEEARRKSEEAINNKKNRGSKYCTSSSEVSVKTVIYRGGSKKNIISAGEGGEGKEGGGGGVLISSPSSNGSYNLSPHRKIHSPSTGSSTFHHRQPFKLMNELRSSHETSSSTPQPVITNSPYTRKHHKVNCHQQQTQKQVMRPSHSNHSSSSPSSNHSPLHPLTTHHNLLHQHLYHQNNGRNLEELHNFSSNSRKHLYLDCIKRNDLPKLNGDSYLVRRRRKSRNVTGVEKEEDEKGEEDGELGEEEEVVEVAFQDVIYRTIDKKGYSSSVRRRRNRRRSRSWRERAKSNELWVDGPLCRDNTSSCCNKPSTSKKQEKPHNLSTQDRRKILLEEDFFDKQERIQEWIQQQHTKQIWSNILLTKTSSSSSTPNHRTRLSQGNKPDFLTRNQSPETEQLNRMNDVTQFEQPCCEKKKNEIIDKIDGKRIQGPSSDAHCCLKDTKPLKDDDNHKNDHKSPPSRDTVHSLPYDNGFYGSDTRRSIDPGHETDPGHLMSESEAEEVDRDAISECYCWDTRGPSSLDEEIRSELSTEPPGMLKLEQFLKKLIEVTAPVTKDNLKESESKGGGGGEGSCSHVETEETDGSSVGNNFSTSEVSDSNRSNSRNCGQLLPVTLSLLNNEVLELQKVQVGFSPQLPTSPRVNRLISTGGNNGPLFPSLSPAHSKKSSGVTTLSRASSGRNNSSRQKGMQQKRNTTSTTTSGHGTTSEGESNSSGGASKEVVSSSKASSLQTTPSPVTKSKPPSSGYDSTINDDESDHRTLHQVRNNHTNQTVLNVSSNESLVRLREKESMKSIMKRQKKKRDTIGVSNDPKRDSVLSENGSIVCCKFFC